MTNQILRIAEVLKATGLSRSTICQRINDGEFPPPVRLGGTRSRAVGWRHQEVHDWIASRPQASEIA